MLANLLDNAIKYVPRSKPNGARVTVTVSRVMLENGGPAGEIEVYEDGVTAGEIVVEDNGAGVPLAQQGDLFKRFFRGDARSDDSIDSGAGLGLAIVHDIVAMHGGSMSYADAPDGGARFIVRIPLV